MKANALSLLSCKVCCKHQGKNIVTAVLMFYRKQRHKDNELKLLPPNLPEMQLEE